MEVAAAQRRQAGKLRGCELRHAFRERLSHMRARRLIELVQ